MPCESCNIQFSVFKRKSKCSECRRYFCSSCLFKKNSKLLCKKCIIFLKRPISKIDLNSLKIKDLVIFLQSKKISTSGCVEKEELINLVIAYSNSSNNSSSNQSNSDQTTTPNSEFDYNYSNSFEQIKQTCQNLFTSFTDKISTDFQKHACFSNTPPNSQQQPPHEYVTTEQPRCSPVQPPFGSPGFSNTQIPHANSNNSFTEPQNPKQQLKNLNLNSNGSSETTSPVLSSPANNSQNQSSASSAKVSLSNIPKIDGCECSDDEVEKQTILDNKPGPSGVPGSSQSNKVNNKKTNSSRMSTESSSFEELGAVGGDSTENWQFIEKTSSNGVTVASGSGSGQDTTADSSSQNTNQTSHDMCQSMLEQDKMRNSEILRRVMRRRSDSSIIVKKTVPSPTSLLESPLIDGNEAKKLKVSCKKCGKQKNRIKQEIQRFREQLEQSNQSEAEKNAQFVKFLSDLEKHSRQSTEITDSEESQASQATRMNVESNTNVVTSTSTFDIEEDIFDDINDGIHVYGSNEEAGSTVARRFTQLEDIGTSDDLENLSVKQLKEILMLNRVDFKGCCEKTELKERVMRLWKHHLEAPSSDVLPTEELCKICMDKPIQCIFLECGHMATCINCGKVLNECPICRQYVVRVVRFFKS